MDLLAWNLGNPDGNMTSLQQGNKTIQFHPMKGPMTTQTLRGLVGQDPYHWRGDMPNFAAFNSAFAGLLGGQQLSDADMAAFTSFINTIRVPALSQSEPGRHHAECDAAARQAGSFRQPK